MLSAEFYSENQSMQLYDTQLFLESVIPKLDSSSQNQDVMMDIGCGPGKTCLKMLQPAFPAVRKIIGVDVSEDMIEFAKKNNAHEKIEYHVADIEDRNTILKWSQKISKVISIFCFHWLEKQNEAFENVYHVLTPGGEAALIFVLSTPLWDSYQLHYNNPKYRKYLENKRSYVPKSHFKKYDAAFYQNLLQGIGFDVIVCEDVKRTFTFPNDDVCRATVYSLCGLTKYIPDELRSEFKEDNFQNFLKYNDRSSNGRPTLYHTILTLVATMLFAEFYSENQSMQLYDAKLFLESVMPKLDSSSENQDVMMDIGCGPGKTCVKLLLTAFPAVKKIIGVDVSEDMIEFAKKNNAHEKIEYHVADIEDRNTILKWSQQISKVTSVLCFHWLEKQKEAFENVYHILKPGGEAALVFVLTSAVWESYQLHYSNPKYKKYLENKRSYVPESHFKKHDAAFYRNLLQGIGFDVIVCEEEKRSFTFPSDDVCRDALYSLCGLTNYIPDELRTEFKEDTFKNFLMKNGCSDDGKHTVHYVTITLVIKKPYA